VFHHLPVSARRGVSGADACQKGEEGEGDRRGASTLHASRNSRHNFVTFPSCFFFIKSICSHGIIYPELGLGLLTAYYFTKMISIKRVIVAVDI
jgi:hypothetical protein